MNYIVLDLEWNQCPQGKEKENRKIPFEIVEIGAVKISSDMKYIDKFHQYVSPVVYRELHRITKDIINVTMEELDTGLDFVTAINDFFSWCGNNNEYVFCTWGSMDITELQRNCRYFEVNHIFERPLIYYDLQKLYSICYDDGKSRFALETAIEQMNIEKNNSFHSALNDAEYTAKILMNMDFEKVMTFSSVDTYVIPSNRSQEFTLKYGTYSKFVSHGYEDKDTLMKDGVILSTPCYLCDKKTRKKIRWFSTNQKMYYCVAHCLEHGYIRGKIKIKKTDDNQYYAIKIIKPATSENISSIKQKQIAAREKRREKRRRDKEKLHS